MGTLGLSAKSFSPGSAIPDLWVGSEQRLEPASQWGSVRISSIEVAAVSIMLITRNSPIMKKDISRRSFIEKTAIAAASATALPTLALAGSRKSAFNPKGLPTRRLGKVGIDVPLLAFGLGSRWMSVADDDKALEMLEYALDHGVFYWDTAAGYKNDRLSSEERIGRLLPSRRQEVFLVTKTGQRDADSAKAEIERSLQRLNTDYIDLLHVHAINSVEDAESLDGEGKVLKAFHDLRDQGVIKHLGFTGHTTAEGMKRAAELYDFEAMMIAMNHQVKNRREDFESSAVPAAARNGLGVIAMKVIRPRETVDGLDPAELLRYALTLDHVACANIGTDSMDVLKANLETIRTFKPLSPERMKELTARMDPFFRSRELPWMQRGYRDGLLA